MKDVAITRKQIIKMKEQIMIDAQAQIRLAENMLEENHKIYKRAMEEKLHQQQLLIEELEKFKV